jgi:hypothetical protein
MRHSVDNRLHAGIAGDDDFSNLCFCNSLPRACAAAISAGLSAWLIKAIFRLWGEYLLDSRLDAELTE